MLKRIAVFIYGLICYAIFFGTFLYSIGFIGNFLVPKSIDSPAVVPWTEALLINLLLLSVFAIQHSVMARPAFKRWFTRFIPEAAERSTYVLLASLALILLFWQWQPLGGTIWEVNHQVGQTTLYSLYALGWALVLISTFLINHFDLFGLRQVWLQLIGKPYTSLKFVTPGPYRLVRHPLYVGWLFVFWATPTMTITHLLFALVTTAYILVAIQFEERDLITFHGDDYRNYRKQVPMLIPRVGRRAMPARSAHQASKA